MPKLTKSKSVPFSGSSLTKEVDPPFVIALKYQLPNNYNLSSCSREKVKELQKFLDKVSKMSVSQVDKMYLKHPDKNDRYNDRQVQHYAVSNAFRIHGVFEDGLFYVIRIDPNHSFH